MQDARQRAAGSELCLDARAQKKIKLSVAFEVHLPAERPQTRATQATWAIRDSFPDNQKKWPQCGLRTEAILFLGAKGRLRHPSLSDHIPRVRAISILTTVLISVLRVSYLHLSRGLPTCSMIVPVCELVHGPPVHAGGFFVAERPDLRAVICRPIGAGALGTSERNVSFGHLWVACPLLQPTWVMVL
jgi:hypothetical protein